MTANSLKEQTSQTLVTAKAIPENKASVTVSVESLSSLPDGAGYTARDGRASVEVKRYGSNFIITSKCDSIQRLLFLYQRSAFQFYEQIDSLKMENERLAEFERHSNTVQELSESSSTLTERKPLNYWWVWLTLGTLLGFILSDPIGKGIKLLTKIVK
ncbi:hypothetical protein [Viscerimonas tarda]